VSPLWSHSIEVKNALNCYRDRCLETLQWNLFSAIFSIIIFHVVIEKMGFFRRYFNATVVSMCTSQKLVSSPSFTQFCWQNYHHQSSAIGKLKMGYHILYWLMFCYIVCSGAMFCILRLNRLIKRWLIFWLSAFNQSHSSLYQSCTWQFHTTQKFLNWLTRWFLVVCSRGTDLWPVSQCMMEVM